MEIRFELPDIQVGKTTEQVREEFKEKVIDPFNKAFAEFQISDSSISDSSGVLRRCFELLQEDLQENEVAFGAFSHLCQGMGRKEGYAFFASFYLNGQAMVRGEIELEGSWEQVFRRILEFIQNEFRSVRKTLKVIDKIGKAISLLE